MDENQYETLLSEVVSLVQTAADTVMTIYNSGDFGVVSKADNSPLTKADTAANRIIMAGLHKLTPSIPIVSEESLIDDEVRLAADSIWLVDPVDGTKEFIKQNGQFTINITEAKVLVLGSKSIPRHQSNFTSS
jgi:3'(2'), 5'-bisphosphate nucleotidase